VSLGKTLNVTSILGPSIYPLWWPILTRNMQTE